MATVAFASLPDLLKGNYSEEKSMKFTKRIFVSILTVVMTAMLVTGCTSSENTADTTQPTSKYSIETMNEGKLTIGMEIEYPPFEEYAEDGVTPTGYDIDLAKAIGDKLGLEVEFINTSLDGILKGIGVNYDCVISAITITEERKETVLFTDAYIDNYQAVVVPADSDMEITSLNDLDGKTVALQKKSSSDALIEDMTGKGTISCTKVAQERVATCFTQLSNGEVDVALIDSTVADGFVADSPDEFKIAYLDKTSPEQFGIAVGKEDTQMQETLNAILDELEAEGFLEDNYTKWFGSAE